MVYRCITDSRDGVLSPHRSHVCFIEADSLEAAYMYLSNKKDGNSSIRSIEEVLPPSIAAKCTEKNMKEKYGLVAYQEALKFFEWNRKKCYWRPRCGDIR